MNQTLVIGEILHLNPNLKNDTRQMLVKSWKFRLSNQTSIGSLQFDSAPNEPDEVHVFVFIMFLLDPVGGVARLVDTTASNCSCSPGLMMLQKWNVNSQIELFLPFPQMFSFALLDSVLCILFKYTFLPFPQRGRFTSINFFLFDFFKADICFFRF